MHWEADTICLDDATNEDGYDATVIYICAARGTVVVSVVTVVIGVGAIVVVVNATPMPVSDIKVKCLTPNTLYEEMLKGTEPDTLE